jgi:hypothetical protein
MVAGIPQAPKVDDAEVTALRAELCEKDALIQRLEVEAQHRYSERSVEPPAPGTPQPQPSTSEKPTLRDASSAEKENAAAQQSFARHTDALTRAVEAEAETAKLRSELRTLSSESKRKLDVAHSQLAECRGRLARGWTFAVGPGGDVDGRDSGRDDMDNARDSAPMPSIMEMEVEHQRLELKLSDSRAELEIAARRLTRQERVAAKLMAELREEKTRLAAREGSHAAIERLRVGLVSKMGAASTRLQRLHDEAAKELAHVGAHLTAAVSTEQARAAEAAAQMQAEAADARMEALEAAEKRERTEARATALEARVSAQARLVAAMLRQSPHSRGALAVSEAEEHARRMMSAAALEPHTRSELETVPSAPASPLQGDDALSSPTSASHRLLPTIGALADGVIRVASAARSYASGASPTREHGADGRGCKHDPVDEQYVALVEDELGRVLQELTTHRGATHELELENARLDGYAEEAGEADEATAALAAAEAAADALLAGDDTPHDAATEAAEEESATLLSSHSTRATSPRCSELRQQAAAAALLDELRLEALKSARLEKIISNLMVKLRTAKLSEVANGDGANARVAFCAAAERLELALQDNERSLQALDGTMRLGLETVAERAAAERHVEASLSARREDSKTSPLRMIWSACGASA